MSQGIPDFVNFFLRGLCCITKLLISHPFTLQVCCCNRVMIGVMATTAVGVAIAFASRGEAAPCLSGTVTVNVSSAIDAYTLSDTLNCTGHGRFDIMLHSSIFLDETIYISYNKNVTITGFGFPTILGGVEQGNDAGDAFNPAIGTGIFSVSEGSTLRLFDLALEGGRAEFGGAVELWSSSSLFVYGCTFFNNHASFGGETIWSIRILLHMFTVEFIWNMLLH